MEHRKSPHFKTGSFHALQGHLQSFLVKSPGPGHVLNIDLEPADGIAIGIHPSSELPRPTDFVKRTFWAGQQFPAAGCRSSVAPPSTSRSVASNSRRGTILSLKVW